MRQFHDRSTVKTIKRKKKPMKQDQNKAEGIEQVREPNQQPCTPHNQQQSFDLLFC
jgi:hypothetical protein